MGGRRRVSTTYCGLWAAGSKREDQKREGGKSLPAAHLRGAGAGSRSLLVAERPVGSSRAARRAGSHDASAAIPRKNDRDADERQRIGRRARPPASSASPASARTPPTTPTATPATLSRRPCRPPAGRSRLRRAERHPHADLRRPLPHRRRQHAVEARSPRAPPRPRAKTPISTSANRVCACARVDERGHRLHLATPASADRSAHLARTAGASRSGSPVVRTAHRWPRRGPRSRR